MKATVKKIEAKGWNFATTTNGKVCAKKGSQTIIAENVTQLLKKI